MNSFTKFYLFKDQEPEFTATLVDSGDPQFEVMFQTSSADVDGDHKTNEDTAMLQQVVSEYPEKR